MTTYQYSNVPGTIPMQNHTTLDFDRELVLKDRSPLKQMDWKAAKRNRYCIRSCMSIVSTVFIGATLKPNTLVGFWCN